jgi:hypothetical protein
MSGTYEQHDGCTTLISDAGRQRLDAEQRQRQAEILMWSVTASVVSIAGLLLNRLIGG